MAYRNKLGVLVVALLAVPAGAPARAAVVATTDGGLTCGMAAAQDPTANYKFVVWGGPYTDPDPTAFLVMTCTVWFGAEHQSVGGSGLHTVEVQPQTLSLEGPYDAIKLCTRIDIWRGTSRRTWYFDEQQHGLVLDPDATCPTGVVGQGFATIPPEWVPPAPPL